MNYSKINNNHCRVIGRKGSGAGQLYHPMGILMDKDTGNIIVTEYGNNRVQVMKDDGSHVYFIGNGNGSNPGQLNNPYGLALSDEGRLIVCDCINNRIQYWHMKDGRYLGQFGVESNPQCVAIGPSGDQLFVSLYSNKIGVYGMDGQLIRSIGSKGSKDGQLNYPIGLAFNSRGNLLVGERNNKRISVFEGSSGVLKTKLGEFGGYGVNMAVDSFDRVIVSDNGSHRLEFFDSNFKSIGKFGSNGNGIGQFNNPNGVWIDEENDCLIVCDSINNRLQIIKDAY